MTVEYEQLAYTAKAMMTVMEERQRQVESHGVQELRDVTTSLVNLERQLVVARRREKLATSWETVLVEEVFEALSARSSADRRAELAQVAAVAVQWIEAIDRRADADAAGCAQRSS